MMTSSQTLKSINDNAKASKGNATIFNVAFIAGFKVIKVIEYHAVSTIGK